MSDAVRRQTGNTDAPGIYYYGLDTKNSWLTRFPSVGVRYRLVELYGSDHVLSPAAERNWMSMNRKTYGAILAITSPEPARTISDSLLRLCKDTLTAGAIGWWAGPGSDRITPTSALYTKLVADLNECTQQ